MAARFTSFTIGRRVKDIFLDAVEIDPSGIIRIRAWSRVPFDSSDVPRVCLDRENVPFLQHYRVTRPDVESAIQGIKVLQAGLVFEYLVPECMISRPFKSISVALANVEAYFEGAFAFVNPHYRALFDSPKVYHRDDIYGGGPPNTAVHPDIVALAKKLRGPVLDFGCGAGALITELHAIGIEAHGLELDSQIIRQSIQPALAPYITLYDGQFPSPFPAGSFRSVFCSEVLEHISQLDAAIHEIARLASETVIFTVPDASAIPLGFPHFLLPWHLLESTHLNFFNQANLRHALEPHFATIDFGRICPCTMNDSPFHVSLVAVCLK
jgi:SAM-dependent methyltransferase